MPDLFTIIRPLLHALPPELAHQASLKALKCGFLPANKPSTSPILSQNILGLEFKTPLGIAAGFDKNAEVVNPLLMQGFSFIEAGTVTPLPQAGNDKPRIFRLPEDNSIINRLGFNNDGLDIFVKNFSKHNKKFGIAGANIGKNRDTEDAAADYVKGLTAVYPYADYITINISSPNTKGLRDLQKRASLSPLLAEISKAREQAINTHNKKIPIFLKISPDIDGKECENIAEAIISNGIDGLIISNTTISRPEFLKSARRSETGGLSGPPLFASSTKTLANMYKITKGKIPLIGVGGIASPEDAYIKIRAGASLIQMYTALVYQGLGLVRSINDKLPIMLERDGFKNISEAIGSDIN